MIIYWTKSSSDFFSTASDWSSGTVPGVFDQAQINAPGSYTVTVNDSEAVLSLSTAFEAILDITGTGHLFMAEGTGDGGNFGTILLSDAAGCKPAAPSPTMASSFWNPLATSPPCLPYWVLSR